MSDNVPGILDEVARQAPWIVTATVACFAAWRWAVTGAWRGGEGVGELRTKQDAQGRDIQDLKARVTAVEALARELATKDDLDAVSDKMDRRVGQLEQRLCDFLSSFSFVRRKDNDGN